MRLSIALMSLLIAAESPDSCCETAGVVTPPRPSPTGPTAPTGPTSPTGPSQAFGTDVGAGNLAGPLTRAGSPYRVRGHIVVPSTATLEIEPGVTVMFMAPVPAVDPHTANSKYRLTVFGNVNARGTADHPIVFTAEDTTIGWWGIDQDVDLVSTTQGQTELSTRPSVYEHVIFEHARKDGEWWAETGPRPWSRGGALNINLTGLAETPSQITLSHCTFRRNYAREACGAVDLMTAFSAVVADNVFEDNESRDNGGGALCLSHGTGTSVVRNVFRRNHTANPAGGEADIAGGAALDIIDSNDTLIEHNLFADNEVAGPFAPGSAILVWTSFANSTIRFNTFQRNRADPSLPGAVYLYDNADMTVSDNDFTENEEPWVVVRNPQQ